MFSSYVVVINVKHSTQEILSKCSSTNMRLFFKSRIVFSAFRFNVCIRIPFLKTKKPEGLIKFRWGWGEDKIFKPSRNEKVE